MAVPVNKVETAQLFMTLPWKSYGNPSAILKYPQPASIQREGTETLPLCGKGVPIKYGHMKKFIYLCFNGSIVTHNMTLVAGLQHGDSPSLNIMCCSPKCSSHLSSRIYRALDNIPWVVLSSLWLIHSTPRSLYLLFPFTHFAHPPSPTPLWQPSICPLHLWFCFCFLFICCFVF